jgi:DNA-binding NarL/FixJ family response regulator
MAKNTAPEKPSPGLLDTDADAGTSSVRILVVDDYEPFRQFIRSTLGERSEWRIVAEVSDGLEAVHKAEELQPDLIMLDIGLPTLNGIDAARRIRSLSPKSKILFVSQESSADVVQEALNSKALGYVVKARAGSELLPAVEAVLKGQQFIGSGLADCNFTDARDTPGLEGPRNDALAPLVSRKTEGTRNHEVQFFPDDESFLVGFAQVIKAGLEAGDAVIVIATESHRKGLLQRLQDGGVDCVAAIEQGRYIALDVAETFSTFMVDRLPDPDRFFKFVTTTIESGTKATKGNIHRVTICGECAPTLWAQGNTDAAI